MKLTDFIGLSRDIGARFTLIGVIPTAVFELFVLALVWSGAPGDAPDLDRILDEARALDGWSGGLLLVLLLAAALVLQPLQLGLVRILEGYWGATPIGAGLAAAGRKLQEGRLDALEQRLGEPVASIAEAYDLKMRRERLYPQERALLLPTRLGNVLRSSEERAGAAYGLDAVVAWPRLYPLLPEPARALVDDQRDQLDLSARWCAVFLAAAAVSLALLIQHGPWLAVPAACLVLAWISYRGAIAAALAYGDGIRATFDLHRFELLKGLHLPLPATRSAELITNPQLMQFMVDDAPVDFIYSHDGTGAPPPDGYRALPQPPQAPPPAEGAHRGRDSTPVSDAS